MDEKLLACEGAQAQQRINSPSTAGPRNAFPPAWQIYDNPLFYDEGARGHLKAELEKERRLRASAARDAAEERRKREAAETKLEELEEELKRAHDETMRLKSATAPSPEAPEKTATDDAAGLREQRQCRYQRQRQRQQQRGGADQRRRCEQEKMMRKEVENPHIRRGIVGFVEFPRMMRNRTRSGGGTTVGATGKRVGKAGEETVPSLECQKAQLRVLLKNNRVSPVVSNFPIPRSGG